MVGLTDKKLCEHCWHSPEKPCPKLLDCLANGPQCHEDEECVDRLKEWKMKASRLILDRPVIYIGTGTCGLGAGAGKVLEAVNQWLADHSVDAEVVEVGCIGLCVEEPLLEVQLPGAPGLCSVRYSQTRWERFSPFRLGAIFTMSPFSDSRAKNPWSTGRVCRS